MKSFCTLLLDNFAAIDTRKTLFYCKIFLVEGTQVGRVWVGPQQVVHGDGKFLEMASESCSDVGRVRNFARETVHRIINKLMPVRAVLVGGLVSDHLANVVCTTG